MARFLHTLLGPNWNRLMIWLATFGHFLCVFWFSVTNLWLSCSYSEPQLYFHHITLTDIVFFKSISKRGCWMHSWWLVWWRCWSKDFSQVCPSIYLLHCLFENMCSEFLVTHTLIPLNCFYFTSNFTKYFSDVSFLQPFYHNHFNDNIYNYYLMSIDGADLDSWKRMKVVLLEIKQSNLRDKVALCIMTADIH